METPEPVGGLELEKSAFSLSVSASSFHGDLQSPVTLNVPFSSVCGDKTASNISANRNLIQTKVEGRVITFNQKHMFKKTDWTLAGLKTQACKVQSTEFGAE